MNCRCLLSAVVVMLSWACSPTCERTCKKILSCDNVDAPSMNIDECTSACSAQQNLYEDWEDEEKEQAFKDLKTCIVAEECASVAEGVCYDEQVYIW